MSADAIARWNAIPMSRLESEVPGPQRTSMKRYREEDNEDVAMNGDDSDDDMTIASRTPSPPPHDGMDLDKYDEYVPGPDREVITVETRIKNTNKGFAMLAKLGWSEGQPLGLSNDGRVDPVPFQVKRDLTGLGKTSQDVRMIETTVSQRRGLDSERQRKETEDQRRAREDLVARKTALQTEISETLKAFYCVVCDKQFQNVAQYDEHTNSYAHHHKVRFRDMQAAQRQKQNTQEELERRNEKERKREEKHLRKIAAAAGVKMAKPAAVAPALAPVLPSEVLPKKSGWATVSTAAAPAQPRGWATVGPAPSAPSPPPPEPSTSRARALPSLSQLPAPPPAPSSDVSHHQPAPAFRTGGWSSLDTTTTPPPILPPIAASPSAMSAPPPPPASSGGWTSQSTPSAPSAPVPSSGPSQGGWASVGGTNPQGGWGAPSQQPPTQQIAASPIIPAPSDTKAPPPKVRKDEIREKSRSGWQSFQSGGRRK